MTAPPPDSGVKSGSKPGRRGPGRKVAAVPWVEVEDQMGLEVPSLDAALVNLDMDLSAKMFPGAEAGYVACKLAAKDKDRLDSPEVHKGLVAQQPQSDLPGAVRRSYLAYALVALIHAERAAAGGQDACAWHHISEARYRVGMAEADYIAVNRMDRLRTGGRKGRRSLAAKRESIAQECAALLCSLRPKQGWASYEAAAEGIVEEVADFIARRDIPGISEYPDDYVLRLMKSHPEVQKAFLGKE